MTTEVSIAAGEAKEEREIRKCPACGATSEEKVLIQPTHLPYEESKAYKGDMYCVSHATRFDGSHLDLVGRLTGGEAA